MLNPTGGNCEFSFFLPFFSTDTRRVVGGRCGYVWGATGFICLVTAYFELPEMKGRSYREIDIMFRRRIPARQFEKTTIKAEDDE